jgi:hypothetical protein
LCVCVFVCLCVCVFVCLCVLCYLCDLCYLCVCVCVCVHVPTYPLFRSAKLVASAWFLNKTPPFSPPPPQRKAHNNKKTEACGAVWFTHNCLGSFVRATGTAVRDLLAEVDPGSPLAQRVRMGMAGMPTVEPLGESAADVTSTAAAAASAPAAASAAAAGDVRSTSSVIRYIGRPASASTATGDQHTHRLETDDILERALG